MHLPISDLYLFIRSTNFHTNVNKQQHKVHKLLLAPHVSISSIMHVARMAEIRNAYNILVGNTKERDHSEDLCVDGKII